MANGRRLVEASSILWEAQFTPCEIVCVEDLLHERGINLCYETVRIWWRRFGPMFANEIWEKRIEAKLGRISKMGDGYLGKLLVGATSAVRRAKSDALGSRLTTTR